MQKQSSEHDVSSEQTVPARRPYTPPKLTIESARATANKPGHPPESGSTIDVGPNS